MVGVDGAATSAANKINNGAELHELTSAEWAAVIAEYRQMIIERLAAGRSRLRI